MAQGLGSNISTECIIFSSSNVWILLTITLTVTWILIFSTVFYQIMRDPESGNSRGFGFISYDSFEASDAAIEVFVLCCYFHILLISVRNMRFNNTRFRSIISLLFSPWFIIYFLYLNWDPLVYSLMSSLTWSTIRLDLHFKKKKLLVFYDLILITMRKIF